MTTHALPLNDSLTTLLGLKDLEDEDRNEILATAQEVVQKRVVLRLLDVLSKEDVAAAAKLSEKPEELMAFLSQKVPDVPALILEEAENVRDELSAGAKTLLEDVKK